MSVTPTKALIDISKLENLADKVRAKTGTSDLMTVDEMATAVENINSTIDYEKLPPEYQKVDYIQGNGDVCINTGLKVDGAGVFLWFIMTFDGYSSGASWTSAFGQDQSGKKLQFGYSGSATSMAWNAGTSGSGVSVTSNVIYDARVYSGRLILKRTDNGSGTMVNAYTTFTDPTYDFYILADGTGGSSGYYGYAKGKVYKAVIGKEVDNSITPVFTYYGVPCYRKSDGVAGLYDTVSKTFNSGVGSGSFTCYPAPTST